MNGFLNIEKSLEELELRANMTAADFGCGSGGWAIPLAKQLKGGRVYAIDILEEPLSALRSKGQALGLGNIETKRSNVEEANGSGLRNSSVDLVLITNLLFECENKKKIFQEAVRVLRDKGQILVVDWLKEAPFGPPKSSRVSTEQITKLAQSLNLRPKKEFKAGKYHFGLVFEK